MKPLRPYFITILIIGGVFAVKALLRLVIPVESPFLMFFSGIILCAWIGGARQAMFAIALSVVGIITSLHIVGPYPLSDASTWGRIALFLFDCLFIAFIYMEISRAQRKAQNNLQALQKSEKRFRSIFDSTMIGLIYSKVSTGEIISVNSYFKDMLGLTNDDFADGKLTWQKITPLDMLEQSKMKAAEVVKVGKIKPFEKEYLRKDGSRVPVLVGSAFLGDDDVVTFTLDISDRRKVDQAFEEINTGLEDRVHQRTLELSQNQKFLDSVIENIPNMIFVKDAKELRFIRFNKAGEQLLGYSRSELLGKNDYDLFPQSEADHFTKADKIVLANNTVVDIPEEPLSTRSGVRYLHTKKIPVMNENGEPIYLLGISEDITSLKEAEKQRLRLMQEQAGRREAEKSAARFEFLSRVSASLSEGIETKAMLNTFAHAVVPNIADGIKIDMWSDTEHGKRMENWIISLQNKEIEKFWQASKIKGGPVDVRSKLEEALGGNETKLYPVVNDEIEKIWFDFKPDSLELRSMMVVPLKAHGENVGFITYMTTKDSGRYFDEFDLELAKDLSRRVGSAMENVFLFEKAQEASRAKSAFLANMSHEIRTPLGAMLGFAELVAEGKNLNPEQQGATSTIIRNGQQLLRIVDEILDLSKVESDRVLIEKIPFSLKRVINDITSLMSLKAAEKNLEFKAHLPDDLPDRIISDPTRIRQVLLNIIGNAIKFTAKGSVQIHVGYSRKDNSDASQNLSFTFTVVDTGIGLNFDQQKVLFQPFSQADYSMTRRFGGTGLGLFLSKKLARLLSGDLVLKSSELGKGSEFLFTFPALMAPEVEQSVPTPKVPVPSPEILRGQGKILIVDDSPDNRDLLTYYVSRMGFDVKTAENGYEAVQFAQEDNFDIVFMDIQMPGMDGVEAVKILRDKKYAKPVVALTAHAMKGDRERFLEEGFDHYVCKPIQKELLYECLTMFTKAQPVV